MKNIKREIGRRFSNIFGFVYFIFLGVVLLCRPTNGQGALLADPPYSKTNLLSFLAVWNAAPVAAGTVCELEPQWVGTVKRAYLRGGEDIYQKDDPNNLRFSHLMVREGLNGRTNLIILRGRTTADGRLGSYVGGEAPEFMSIMPSVKSVSEAKNVDDLHKTFGPQHGITDGWGDAEGRLHSTEGWIWFTAEGDGSLRYLNVFAHVSSAGRGKPTDIDILLVREGLFHPADSNSTAERRDFKTGEELQAEHEAARAKARAVYPLPLRSLVEAREKPDDPDLVGYKRALNDIRRNPSPELFRQLAGWIHEGTREIHGMLENILFDGWLKLEKWEEPQRKIALRALVDALPQAKSNLDLDELIYDVLLAQGGGELKMAVSGSTGVIDIKAKRSPDGRGTTLSTSSHNISAENLTRAAKEASEALKQKYPELRQRILTI